LHVQNLNRELEMQNYKLALSPAARREIVRRMLADSPAGARSLQRIFRSAVEDPFAAAVIRGEFSKGSLIRITCKNGQLRFSAGRELAKSG